MSQWSPKYYLSHQQSPSAIGCNTVSTFTLYAVFVREQGLGKQSEKSRINEFVSFKRQADANVRFQGSII